MQLPQQGKVNVSVFNMIGQQVATAADGVFYAGAHTVNWDGRNTSGHPVPSGVYIVRCRTEQGESNKKILVLH
jgi:flagellar hook assembly protein FlgD